MEAYKSRIHLEDVSRRIHLWLRNKAITKEGFQIIVGSGKPVVIKFNASRREGNRRNGDMAFLARGWLPD